MKLVILIALIALAAAAPVDDKKPAEDNNNNKAANQAGQVENNNNKPAADAKKPVEKSEEKKEGLEWPLPDPINEGDLMLHGVHLFDRVNELRKAKLVNDMDKMVISVGRDYLRRIHKYIEKTPEFKVLPILCRDSNRLDNSSERWEIRLRPESATNVSESQDGQQEKQAAQNEQQQQQQQQQAQAGAKAQQNDPIVPSNATHENVTEAPLSKFSQFETERNDFYERMGDNFARLLLKRYRKEKLEKEESDYLDRWLGEESVHYGVAAIYCHDGENIKETGKRIATFIEEKQ